MRDVSILTDNGVDLNSALEYTHISQEDGIKEKEEISEEEVQAVAKAIVAEAEEREKTVETIVDEIIEEAKEEKKASKPKKTKSKKKN